MGTLVCIKHSEYDGKETPVLSCTTCCSIYVTEIKRVQKKRAAEARKKAREEASSKASSHRWISFDRFLNSP